MLSLIAMIAVFAGHCVLQVVAMTLAARLGRAQRATWRAGVAATALTIVANFILGIVALQVSVSSPGAAIAFAIALLILQLIVVMTICVKIFRPSPAVLAFAPVTAHLLMAGAYVMAISTFFWPHVTESYRMPTASMSPTLDPGDRFFVVKFVEPNRWDCVAYVSNGKDAGIFAKRLVGLPGERLRFDDGSIWINDQRLATPDVLAGKLRVSLPGDSRSRYVEGQSIELGPEEYFFVGDNIDISWDSRLEGPTPQSKLVGVVDLRYWPLGRFKVMQ